MAFHAGVWPKGYASGRAERVIVNHPDLAEREAKLEFGEAATIFCCFEVDDNPPPITEEYAREMSRNDNS